MIKKYSIKSLFLFFVIVFLPLCANANCEQYVGVGYKINKITKKKTKLGEGLIEECGDANFGFHNFFCNDKIFVGSFAPAQTSGLESDGSVGYNTVSVPSDNETLTIVDNPKGNEGIRFLTFCRNQFGENEKTPKFYEVKKYDACISEKGGKFIYCWKELKNCREMYNEKTDDYGSKFCK